MPEPSDSPQELQEVLDRVVTGRRWNLRQWNLRQWNLRQWNLRQWNLRRWSVWRTGRAVPVVAALGVVAVLSGLGVAAPWTDGTIPVRGQGPGTPTAAPVGPEPVLSKPEQAPSDPRTDPPPDPPPGRAEAAPTSSPRGREAAAPGPPSGGAGGHHPPPPPPAPPPAPPSHPAMTSLRLAMGAGLTATLYVGQLEPVMSRLSGKVTFNTDPSFRSKYPRLCVTTVVVEGASGSKGAVYAYGLGPGWRGAEGEPDLRVNADNGTLHQQLIFPPPTAQSGQTWTASASVHLDDTPVADSSDYRLVLDAVDGVTWQWRVAGNGVTVECDEYPR